MRTTALLLAALLVAAAARADDAKAGAAPVVATPPAAAPSAAGPAAPMKSGTAATSAPAPVAPSAPAVAPIGAAAPMPAPVVRQKGPIPESVLALKQADYRVRATVRPGEPQPGKMVELQLDVAQLRDPPDPTYGDEAPIENAQLALTFSGPGPKIRYYLRPLGDAGSYGLHWTPNNKGLWTATLAPLAGQGPQLSFEIGVGVPMPTSARAEEVQASRVVLGARGPRHTQPLTPTMRDIADHWLRLLDSANATEANVEGQRISLLFRSLAGRAPQAFASSEAEFDDLAKQAATAAEAAAHSPVAERSTAMRAVELNSCTRCHMKYRDGMVEDLSHWPEVKPWVR